MTLQNTSKQTRIWTSLFRTTCIANAFHFMKKTDLISEVGLTSPIVAKFAKNEHVSGETIEKLCTYFNCQPGDIMEYAQNSGEEI